MTRPSLCIHGHFYQPPRENPWTGRVEAQPSAAPFHDWNERITAECYRLNSAARLLAGDGLPDRELSNYAHMSFDFGPTLLSYLAREQKDVHEAILAADRDAQRRFSGHGAAIAQGYSHAILPLASDRDRRTEIRWGLRDFEMRFGRASEGMWLPECAVDTPTLEALADEGVRFTILAPAQASRVRPLGGRTWRDFRGSGHGVDTRVPYHVELASGRSMSLFFYDGALAHAVAFGAALSNGQAFLESIEDHMPPAPALVHLATDGETYGHHHNFGEMGLAWVLDRVARGANSLDLTIYAEHLDRHPPRHEVEIVEKSSWSCAHGIERWRSDCGCSGGRRDGNQGWRGPLREALDALRDLIAPVFEREGAGLLKDPWAARDDFAEVLVRRAPRTEIAFLERHATGPLNADQQMRALELLDMQRHALLMYASCAWFFDDLTDIEPMQGLAHAARAIELAGPADSARIERIFRSALARAFSNDGENGSAILDQVLTANRPT